MNSNKRLFFKGLPRFVAENDHLEVDEAAESVYKWWWQSLRLSPVIWFAHETGAKPKDAAIAKVVEAFGDLRMGSFYKWWQQTGRNIFAESKRPSKVKLLALDQLQEHKFDSEKIYIEVPLTIRQQTIVKQFKELLASQHEGRKLNLAAYSQAEFKLHTKRYRLHTLQNEYWVLLYRLLHPAMEYWRIGDRLQIAPHLRLRDADGAIENIHESGRHSPKAHKNAMNSLTGRCLYKARFVLLNAERGSFPNYDAIELSDRYQPFGLKYQTEYRTATEDGNDESESAWKLWLKEEYAVSLKSEIARRNHIEAQLKMPDGKVRRKMDAFIAGESDLLS